MLAERTDVGDGDFALGFVPWLMGQAEKVIGPNEQDAALRVHHIKAPSRQQLLVGGL